MKLIPTFAASVLCVFIFSESAWARRQDPTCESAAQIFSRVAAVKPAVVEMAQKAQIGPEWVELWERAHALALLNHRLTSVQLAQQLVFDGGRPLIDRLWANWQRLLKDESLQAQLAPLAPRGARDKAEWLAHIDDALRRFPRPDQPLTFGLFIQIVLDFTRLSMPSMEFESFLSIEGTLKNFPFEIPVIRFGLYSEDEFVSSFPIRFVMRSLLDIGETTMAHQRRRGGAFLLFHDEQHAGIFRIRDRDLGAQLDEVRKASAEDYARLSREWLDRVGEDVRRVQNAERELRGGGTREFLRSLVLYWGLHERTTRFLPPLERPGDVADVLDYFSKGDFRRFRNRFSDLSEDAFKTEVQEAIAWFASQGLR